MVLQIQSHILRQCNTPCCPNSCAAKAHFVFSSLCSPPQIRGMSIDEAIAQLEFNDKKGAKIMKEVCATELSVIHGVYFTLHPIYT